MRVVDLSKENERLYFVCLEDWSEEIVEAGNHKELWFGKMKDKGLRVKLALDDRGVLRLLSVQDWPVAPKPGCR